MSELPEMYNPTAKPALEAVPLMDVSVPADTYEDAFQRFSQTIDKRFENFLIISAPLEQGDITQALPENRQLGAFSMHQFIRAETLKMSKLVEPGARVLTLPEKAVRRGMDNYYATLAVQPFAAIDIKNDTMHIAQLYSKNFTEVQLTAVLSKRLFNRGNLTLAESADDLLVGYGHAIALMAKRASEHQTPAPRSAS
jgi:hypothetical protein